MHPTQKSVNEFERFRRYYQRLEPVWKKPKNRASSAAIFSFLAVSLFGWYAIRPTAQTVLYLRREIADKIQVNQKMEDKISSLIEAQAAYQLAQQDLPLIDSAIPADPQSIDLLAQLQNLTRVSGASLSAVQIPSVPLLGQDTTSSASGEKKQQGEFLLTVAITGPYQAIKSFLDGLLNMHRLVTIDTVDIQPNKIEKTSESTLQLLLKLKAYYTPRL